MKMHTFVFAIPNEMEYSQWYYIVEFAYQRLQTIPQRVKFTILQYQLNECFTIF